MEIPKIPGLNEQQLKELRDAAKQELSVSPKIALIGETGVGKSTTINSMFNAGVAISHVKACTQEAYGL